MEEAAKLTTGIISARSDSKAVVSAVENEFVKNDVHKDYLEKNPIHCKNVRFLLY